MYEVFDLNKRKVCNIDPETGLISYKFHGNIVIGTLPIGKDLILNRKGTTTRVLRDSSKTFTVELGADDSSIPGIVRRRYNASGPDDTRISLFGDASADKNVHSLDLVLKNGRYFIETKDSRGPVALVSTELISKMIEQITG